VESNRFLKLNYDDDDEHILSNELMQEITGVAILNCVSTFK